MLGRLLWKEFIEKFPREFFDIGIRALNRIESCRVNLSAVFTDADCFCLEHTKLGTQDGLFIH